MLIFKVPLWGNGKNTIKQPKRDFLRETSFGPLGIDFCIEEYRISRSKVWKVGNKCMEWAELFIRRGVQLQDSQGTHKTEGRPCRAGQTGACGLGSRFEWTSLSHHVGTCLKGLQLRDGPGKCVWGSGGSPWHTPASLCLAGTPCISLSSTAVFLVDKN